MNRIHLISVVTLLGGLALQSACATPPAPEVDPVYIEATPEPPAPQPPIVVGVPYAQPITGQAVAWPDPVEPTAAEIEAATAKERSAKEVIEEANERARRAPTPEGFSNATHVYDYMPGRLYQAWGAPNHLTSLVFSPGEEVISYGLGDTVRWLVEKTHSGAGADRHTLLVLEPRARGLHTTMVVTTSIGTYYVELKSYQHTYLASVSFRHPRERLVQLERDRVAQLEREASAPSERAGGMELAVDLADVEDRYRFIVEDRDEPPRWMPRRAFHDGFKTYLVFDHELGDRELPVVAVYSRDKKPRLIQTAVRGRYMIVGEVVERGLLRVGKEHHETVGFELRKEARR